MLRVTDSLTFALKYHDETVSLIKDNKCDPHANARRFETILEQIRKIEEVSNGQLNISKSMLKCRPQIASSKYCDYTAAFDCLQSMAIEGFQDFIRKNAVISSLVTAGKQSAEVHEQYRRDYELIRELYRSRQAKEFAIQESAQSAKREADLEKMMGCLDHLQGPGDELRKACQEGLEKLQVDAVERINNRHRKAQRILGMIRGDRALLNQQKDFIVAMQKAQVDAGLMAPDGPVAPYVALVKETTVRRLRDLRDLEKEYEHSSEILKVLADVVDSGASAVRGHMTQMLKNVEGAKDQLVSDLCSMVMEDYVFYSDMQARFEKERFVLENRRAQLDDALEEAMFSHVSAEDIESRIASNERALLEVGAKEEETVARKDATQNIMGRLKKEYGCVLPTPPDVDAWKRAHESYWIIDRVRSARSIASSMGKLSIMEGGVKEE